MLLEIVQGRFNAGGGKESDRDLVDLAILYEVTGYQADGLSP